MLDYESFIARHDEFAVQALVERVERYEGVKPAPGASLRDRWIAVMQPQRTASQRMAA